MKKKLLAAFMVAAVALVPAMTAFAEPSNPSVEGEKVQILTVVDSDGNVINEDDEHVLAIGPLTESERASVDEVEKPENLKVVLGDNYSEGLQVISELDVFVYDKEKSKEIEWDESDVKFPVTITFSIPGVKEDSVVRVLHGHDGLVDEKEDGEIALAEWHEMKVVSIEDGKVTLTFTHLSPVVFLVDNTVGNESGTPGGTTDGTTDGTTGGTTDGVTSPTTGENNMVFYVALCVVAAVTGAVATRKKTA